MDSFIEKITNNLAASSKRLKKFQAQHADKTTAKNLSLYTLSR